jgi:hypothetical protein
MTFSIHKTRLSVINASKIAVFCLALCLAACTGLPPSSGGSGNNTSPVATTQPMPGDAQFYGFGISQSKEDFANVEIAQSNFGMYQTSRTWIKFGPGRGVGYAALRGYHPFDVRWKLKDGREFILEKIDTAAIMREYFKTNNFLLQHQREGRAKVLGDSSPDLQFGVKDDTVVIKWGLVLNRTPLDKRFPVIVNGIPARDGTPWKLEHEEHFVIALKGKPISGIDFTKTVEVLK